MNTSHIRKYCSLTPILPLFSDPDFADFASGQTLSLLNADGNGLILQGELTDFGQTYEFSDVTLTYAQVLQRLASPPNTTPGVVLTGTETNVTYRWLTQHIQEPHSLMQLVA